MKQFNKFLALALVAGVLSSNLVSMDVPVVDGSVAAGSGMDAVPVAQELTFSLGLPSFKASRKKGAKKANELMRQRSVKYRDLEAERAARIKKGIEDKKRAREADRNESRLAQLAARRAEMTVLDLLIEEVDGFAMSLRFDTGVMSAPTREIYLEMAKPYDDYAAAVEAFADVLKANRDALNAEVARINATGDADAHGVIPNPAVPEGLMRISRERLLNACTIGANFLRSPALATAMRRILPGVVLGSATMFGVIFAGPIPVFAHQVLPLVMGGGVVGGAIGGAIVAHDAPVVVHDAPVVNEALEEGE